MLVGQKFGPFNIEKEIGSGAMGTVYKARMHHKEKLIPVALKVVSPGLLGNDAALGRFNRETAILKQLRHPHIVRLYASGRFHQMPFIAMELIDGEALDRTLARRGRLGWEDALAYAGQLCDALQYAHEKGIIHRDLKPSNLMLTKEGVLKLTDFGIAKDTDVTALTGMNSTIGTAAYMSPEQCRGARDLTAKSDLYSLGVVLFELITGKKPFTAENSVEMFLKHVNEVPPRPTRFVHDLPIWVDNLIMFLLEKKPESRPLDAATVQRMIGDIEEKVQAQLSLGVEAANARRIDRPLSTDPATADDRAAVRALKGGKKRKKKKVIASRTRGRLQMLGMLSVLLALLGTGVWLSWPEGIDKAYARVESAKADDKVEAATTFLAKHGSKSGTKVETVRGIFRDAKAKQQEVVLANRYRKKMTKPEDEYDKVAYEQIMAAMDAELAGNMKRARDCWAIVRDRSPTLDAGKYTDEEEVRKASWRWVAEKRLADIASATTTMERIRKNLAEEILSETKRTFSPTDPEGQATRAVRFILFGDPTRGRSIWDTLANQTEKDAEQHRWFILATEQRAITESDAGKEDEVRMKRIRLITVKLDAVAARWEDVKADPEARLPKREIRNVCREILTLYEDDPTPTVAAQVDRAKKLFAAASAK